MVVSNSVRLARTTDVDDIARVQVRSWRVGYVDVLPSEVLSALQEDDISWEWGRALLAGDEHRVFVAIAEGSGDVVGVASVGPTNDPDLDPVTTAEIGLLLVDPDHVRQGHGSRLMAACIDMVRDAGRSECVIWVPIADEPRRSLLQSAGWGPDGAYRDLEIVPESTVRESRLITVV
jgi:GNAT superfamily N-acetyltransferase